MDKPKQEDLSTGSREKNMTIFFVQNITPVPRVAIGIEYVYWKTEYKGGASGDANRVNAHLTTKF
jgi:hypothetical protein